MAAIGLREQDDPERFVAEFAGDDRHVADYLSDEVLAHQPPELTDFLLRTSLLDRLSGPLCDAITGHDDSQRVLEVLESRSLFLQPLDRRREWFAYHPLFRDLLRYQLRASAGPLVVELLQAAAAWHLDRGEADEAAGYLIRAEDWDGVLGIADEHGERWFARGQAAAVLRWLAAIPEERLRGDVDATLAVAAALHLAGRTVAADDLTKRLEAATPLPTWAVGVVASLRCAMTSFHLPPEAAPTYAAVIDALDDDDLVRPTGPLLGIFSPSTSRAMAVGTVGVASSQCGDYPAARHRLDEVTTMAVASVWQLHTLSEGAFLEASTGNLRRATAAVGRALAVADETGLTHHPATAMAHLALARIQCLRHRPVGGHLDAGLARGRVNDRHRALAVGWAARAHEALLAERPADGLTILDQAEVHGGPPPPPVEAARRCALRLRLLLAHGEVAEARRLADRGWDGLVTADVPSAFAAVATATGDVPRLRKVVEGWSPVDAEELLARVQQGLWTAVLEDLDGDRPAALRTLRAAVDLAAPEGLREPFLDNGERVQRLVQALAHQQPTPFLADVAQARRQPEVPELVEQLTERELEVLAYLPSRLSNASIAAQLYVSINTQKTHTKNIYRKLGVTGREEAVARALELGLL
jgi:LuxR family maltose regulon positive regulatory protein